LLSRRTASRLVCLAVATLVGCASDERLRDQLAPRPSQVRAQIANLLPASTPDRPGWATDIYAAMAALGIAPSTTNLCAVLAVTEQESGFRVNPAVPNLARIAWDEIDRRASRLGVPRFAVRAALQISSPNGRSYSERIDAVRTEKELSEIYEDFIGMVPMGERLFAGMNPVRTGGPMQVSIAFAERHTQERSYPYAANGQIRHEVFTRRGGLYFGIAHLLDYPATYDKHIYRFADFNAGRYASRNAAFQSAVSVISGIPLDLDGDLVRHGDSSNAQPGNTELAARAIGRRLGMSNGAIRRALEQGDRFEFEQTSLYARVFDLADKLERRRLPRAVVPRITLRGPKITRRLTTEWFANRVEERQLRCVARATLVPEIGGM
jgi:hypothetical protein